MSVALNHFSLNIDTYRERLSSGFYKASWPGHLWLKPVPTPSFDDFVNDLLQRVNPDLYWPHHWKVRDPKKFQDESLDTPDTQLYMLMDGDQEVGFTMVRTPTEATRARFFNGREDVIEFDYMAMYHGNEGKGRGRVYFEMLFKAYFESGFNTVYWSQHGTNAPTLKNFYRDKMKMTLLATDEIPDFRPPSP